MSNRPVLCSPEECTGCEACKNSCPKDCIQMLADQEGFLRPEIHYDECVGCGKCESSCPIIHKPLLDRSDEPEVYACWHKNDGIRMKSSSGGAFSALAEVILEQGGVIFGAAYDDQLHVRHIGIEHIDDLDELRRSKYVQSEIGSAFRQVKYHLDRRRRVLFVGTPCQIAGLYGYLGIEDENLLTVDLICGGAPSPEVFSGYVDSLEHHFSTKLQNINFRDKRHGWENNTVIAASNDKQYQLKGNSNNYYFAGYILHCTLRNSCFQCPAIGLPRMGDMTIADFWGIEKDSVINQNEIDKGISLVMTNSHAAKLNHVISCLKSKTTLLERPFEEAKAGNGPMFNYPQKPSCRELFFQDFKRNGYRTCAKKYLRYPLKRRIIQLIKENTGAGILCKLRRIKQVIGI